MKNFRVRLRRTFVIAILIILSYQSSVFAQSAPRENFLYDLNTEILSAQSFLVLDSASGKILTSKNQTAPHVPASLTKLMTALVVLESKVDLKKQISIKKEDEVGGVRIATKPGVKYRANDLLYASLISSANNATNALTRVTGLNQADFVKKMNEKAKALGANNTIFVEPTGISPKNLTTAEDFAKIALVAFSDSNIQNITQLSKFTLRSTNNKRFIHKLKTTNQLLAEKSWIITAAKTGFLDESRYNFAAQMRDVDGKDILVVLLGSKSQSAQFLETKRLALWSWLNFIWPKQPAVAGVNTSLILNP